jgi:hypothetical protein
LKLLVALKVVSVLRQTAEWAASFTPLKSLDNLAVIARRKFRRNLSVIGGILEPL